MRTQTSRLTKPETHRNAPYATVFFDGACPLCGAEIAHYRRLRGAQRVRWVDISEDAQALADHGLTRATAMARFHVLDADGRWQTGAWGFAELWSHLPAYRWLSYGVRKLRLLPLLDHGYRWFARWRSRRVCASGRCEPQSR